MRPNRAPRRAVVLFYILLAVGSPTLADEVPRHGIVDLACELVWEAPGEAEDYLFGGLLVSAGWDQAGELCVVDYENRDLKVFDAEGRLWIDLDLGGRSPVPGTIAWIDVHDGDRGWLQQRRLTGPFDPDTDQWRFVDDRHLLVLALDEADEPVLRLLRLPPTGH